MTIKGIKESKGLKDFSLKGTEILSRLTKKVFNPLQPLNPLTKSVRYSIPFSTIFGFSNIYHTT